MPVADVPSCIHDAKWIVLLPFIAGLFIIVSTSILKDKMPKTLCMLASIGAVAWGFYQSLLIFNELRLSPVPYVKDYTWFMSDSFRLTMGVLVDNLTSSMLIVVTAVSLLVQVYTHGYMREDPGYRRFYSYLSLFTGSMLGLVVATNLFQMFFFWELVGVCSYLLIGFWWYKESAAAACLKAFVVNRIGDFGFLVGIMMFLACTYGFWHGHLDHGLLSFYDRSVGPIGSALDGVTLGGAIKWAMAPSQNLLTQGLLTTIAILIFMGPMAKSAQFPLHVWLPDAMEGPTPISALIHAATMVAAGVYMVARAYPIWLDWSAGAGTPGLLSTGLTVVAWVGGFTAFMAATVALTQVDIKRALAWSTVSQLGYMFVGLGTGALSSGMFHLTTHAFFKAMLFLCSGAVIHALHGEQDMRNMGGLLKKIPITGWCFIVGTLAISGCPGLSGFFSKDEIIGSAFGWQGPGHEALAWLTVITAGMTAYYMFRMVFMTFLGEYRGTAHVHEEKSPDPLTWPLIVLAIPSIGAGYAMGVGQHLTDFTSAKEFVAPFSSFVYFLHPHAEAANQIAMGFGTGLAIAGFILAMVLYNGKGYEADKAFEKAMPQVYNFSLNRWYMDNVFLGGAAFFVNTGKAVWEVVDKFFVDGVVNSMRWIFLGLGNFLKFSENGRGQAYALLIFASVAVLGLVAYFVFVP